MCDANKLKVSDYFQCDDKTCTIDRQVFDQIRKQMDNPPETRQIQEKHETFRRLDYENTAMYETIRTAIWGATITGSAYILSKMSRY